MPTGKATAMPDSAMAATSRMLAALKTAPPNKAEPMLAGSAWARSARKARPLLPELPRVNAKSTAASTTPST